MTTFVTCEVANRDFKNKHAFRSQIHAPSEGTIDRYTSDYPQVQLMNGNGSCLRASSPQSDVIPHASSTENILHEA